MAPVRGDLSGRPEEDEVFATITPEVLENEMRYNARAVLVNIGLDRPRTEARHVIYVQYFISIGWPLWPILQRKWWTFGGYSNFHSFSNTACFGDWPFVHSPVWVAALFLMCSA
jgi:hypothetical protein